MILYPFIHFKGNFYEKVLFLYKKTDMQMLNNRFLNLLRLFCLMKAFNAFCAGLNSFTFFLNPLQVQILPSFSCNIGMAPSNSG